MAEWEKRLEPAAGGGFPLPHVHFYFDSPACPEAAWHVQRVHVSERLCELYEATLELTFDVFQSDVDALLGASCELRLERGGLPRRFLGLVRRVEQLGMLAGKGVARVYLVPALWTLSQRVDSSIFQEMTVPQVLEEVLSEGLAPLRRKVRLALEREYPEREYCVQYAESDLDFALRLMREEGISFYFEQGGEVEELVLVDDNLSFPACELVEGREAWVSNEAGTLAHTETVRGLEWDRELGPTGVVVRDFEWTRPRLDLTKQVRGEEAGREQYVYPADFALWGYGPATYQDRGAGVRARLLREGQLVGARRGRGQGNVTSFRAGYTFTLRGHLRPELDQAWLLTRVEHEGEAPEERPITSQQQAGHERYTNRFECIPRSVPFRPAFPLEHRRMLGPQTATVVGPAGEEIHTDEHGRIKVQFHWDRAGRRGERASCWVRVAQAWAGLGFGTLFIPRVGMEVVVHFLEGNPDRPLVTGCVYNGANVTPTRLPEERTRSTLRTESTPGGDGYNELRFEDASGQEQIFLHAQKDLAEVVKHDHSTQVGNDQSNSVQANQTESVGGNQSLSVSGSRTTRVVGKETTTLEDARETTIAKTDLLTVSQDKTDTVHANYTITADTKFELRQGSTTFTLTGNHAELDAASWIELRHGAGSIRIEEGGAIRLNSSAEIELTCGACTIKLKEGKIEVSGPVEVLLSGGSAALKLDSTAAAISGTKLSASATALSEITGPIVKIN